MSDQQRCAKCELTRHFGTSDEAFIARYHASDHNRALIEEYAKYIARQVFRDAAAWASEFSCPPMPGEVTQEAERRFPKGEAGR